MNIPNEPIGWPLLTVPQDGELTFPTLAASVRQQIEIILSTRPSEQLMRPTFGAGLENLLNEPNTVTTRQRIHDLVAESLDRWEPRIDVDAIAVDPFGDDAGGVRVEIAYRIKRTQLAQRVGLTLAMDPGSTD